MVCEYWVRKGAKENRVEGKKIKQINNLTIRYTETYQYAVWTPDGRCWEDRLTLEQAEDFCRNTKDFIKKRGCFGGADKSGNN